MARPAGSKRCEPTPKSQPVVRDERSLDKILPRSSEIGDNSKTIRTVLYVEVGDLLPNHVRQICSTILKSLDNGHIHYVCPMRNGKITNDIIFEEEVLEFIRQICEVKNGEIVLRDGINDIDVIRKQIR